MDEKRLIALGVIGGMGLGLIALDLPALTTPLRDFTGGFVEGLRGGSPEASQATNAIAALQVERAHRTLNRELTPDEMGELVDGMIDFINGRNAEALPVLSKYAMLGNGDAQGAIGAMYYFGLGLPVDREEAIGWLGLAAAQGGPADRQMLASAVNGTLQWDSAGSGERDAFRGREQPAPQYGRSDPIPRYPDVEPGYGIGSPYVAGGMGYDSPAIGARRSVDDAYGSGSAARSRTGEQFDLPRSSAASPVILNPAGPRNYSDSNGDIYVPAGPHGVVNTRTGEFSPTN